MSYHACYLCERNKLKEGERTDLDTSTENESCVSFVA